MGGAGGGVTFFGSPAGIGPVKSDKAPGFIDFAISAEGVPGFGATSPFWIAFARFMATAWFCDLGGITFLLLAEDAIPTGTVGVG